MSSWHWVGVIVFGGALVVLGNIQYARSKADEDSKKVEKSALSILEPELLKNHQTAFQILNALNNQTISYSQLSMGAWKVCTEANLISNLPEEKLNKIINAYQHIENAMLFHKKLIDHSSGTGAAMSGAPKVREVIISNLQHELNNVIATSQELLEKPAPNKSMQPTANASAD
ncbi:hypothetical protein [Shewanella psychrotolerans]|uniref:hypothetical protein n=1 Tax=Shewanella psychrotolerans TaxID=2864206 RepID=UPI001C65AE65|nr:hypothetical protein [Shewanella psychrotolerans]QYK00791.1 hypothetical protein K0I62_15555 [Shewanella psychrotolerans]